MKTRIVCLLVAAVFVSTYGTNAQVPSIISYQGRIDSAGVPVNGTKNLVFNIYSAASGTSALWTEYHANVPVSLGLFSVALGSLTSFPADLFTGTGERYLGFTISGSAEFSPRLRFLSAPYAFRAARADAISDNVITASNIAPGNVVKSINNLTDRITIAAIGGATVTTSGDTVKIGASGGGSGILGVQNTDNTLNIQSPNGPTATINIKTGGIGETQIADNAVKTAKIADGSVTTAKLVQPLGLNNDVRIDGGRIIINNSTDATVWSGSIQLGNPTTSGEAGIGFFNKNGAITYGQSPVADYQWWIGLNPYAVGGSTFAVTNAQLGGSPAMAWTYGGKVGIGTKDPAEVFHVKGRGLFWADDEWPLLVRNDRTTAAQRNHILFQRSNAAQAVVNGMSLGGLAMGGKYDASSYSMGWDGGAEITAVAAQNWTSTARGAHLLFYTTGAGTILTPERMRITSEGWVGIGTSSPASLLHVAGTFQTSGMNKLADAYARSVTSTRTLYIDATGVLGGISSSSIRYKTNVRPLDSYSSRIYQLRPVVFDYKEDNGSKNEFGLIAEDVDEVFPELVIRNQDNQPESVEYGRLVPLLLNEVVKLKKQTDALQQRIEQLEREKAH